jgi:hypothetical protein
LGENLEIAAEEPPMQLNLHIPFVERNKRCPKHDPLWSNMMHLGIVVGQEIIDEPMHRDIESMTEEVDENYNLTGVDISYAQVVNFASAP